MSAKSKITRVKAVGLANRIDFEITVDRIAYIDTELRTLTAERDAAVQQAQLLHAELIAELESEQKAKVALCEKFAEEHRVDLLPGKAKSAETPLSRYGFRTGMPTLKLLSKWTWEKVLAALQTRLGDDFVRLKPEVDKAKVLKVATERGQLGTSTPLEMVGLRIDQAETFYIEPKVEGGEKVVAS